MIDPGANRSGLAETEQAVVADDKSLLAMDESDPTCNKRFAEAGILQTEAARQAYCNMIIARPGLGRCVNGVILFDGTIRQRTASRS